MTSMRKGKGWGRGGNKLSARGLGVLHLLHLKLSSPSSLNVDNFFTNSAFDNDFKKYFYYV